MKRSLHEQHKLLWNELARTGGDDKGEVIKKLNEDGFPIEFQRVSGRPWKEVLQLIANCDIYIGKILKTIPSTNEGMTFTATGVGAMEAGVFKKPALSMVHELEKEQGCPVVEVNEETLYKELKKLCKSEPLRKRKGNDLYNYVRKYHDIKPVVDIWEKEVGKVWK